MTDSQEEALNKIIDFISSDQVKVFILKGHAGTGKTTLVKAVIKRLISMEQHFTLLASTGRAAKILNDTVIDRHTESSGQRLFSAATTIHSQIYTFDDINQELDLFGQPGHKELATNRAIKLVFRLSQRYFSDPDTVYIIDESSMISDEKEKSLSHAQFGTDGRLLHDLFRYDPDGKFIFIGDDCQLPPPTSQDFSPALNESYIHKVFNCHVASVELTKVMRQPDGNDIVLSASKVRKLSLAPAAGVCALFPFKGYNNIHLLVDETQMLNKYISCIKNKQYDNATLIVLSNSKATSVSELIRPALGFKDSYVSVDDLLLVTQNNLKSGLMNGDLVRVTQVGMREQRAGLSFIHVQVESLSTGAVFSQLLIEDILYAKETNLSMTQQSHLIIDFHKRMKAMGIDQHSPDYKTQLRIDDYMNALRCVYGYALTCHKSQGGEWDNVFLMIPRGFPYQQPRKYVYQWVYTAMTRARRELYVINDYWAK